MEGGGASSGGWLLAHLCLVLFEGGIFFDGLVLRHPLRRLPFALIQRPIVREADTRDRRLSLVDPAFHLLIRSCLPHTLRAKGRRLTGSARILLLDDAAVLLDDHGVGLSCWGLFGWGVRILVAAALVILLD